MGTPEAKLKFAKKEAIEKSLIFRAFKHEVFESH